MITYGDISIRVLADEKEIDGPNELALSTRFYALQVLLEDWLANEMATEFPEFDFVVE